MFIHAVKGILSKDLQPYALRNKDFRNVGVCEVYEIINKI